MGYINGREVLPEELIARIQQYAEGVCIYIPTREKHRKLWGEANHTRAALDQRNIEIYEQYQKGTSVKCLAERYCISTQGIYKIISRQKEK